MTAGKPSPQPDGEDGSTLGASETDSEQELGDITVPSSDSLGLPSIDDVLGLEDLYASTSELDVYQEPAIVDMSALGNRSGPAPAETSDDENNGESVDPAETPGAVVADVDSEPVDSEEAEASDDVMGVPVDSEEAEESDDVVGVPVDSEDPTVVPSTTSRTGGFADLVKSPIEQDPDRASTIFERWPEDHFDPGSTQPMEPVEETSRRPAIATPDLRLSTESAPVPTVQWSTVVHEPRPFNTTEGGPDHKQISDVPTPDPPPRRFRGPGQLRDRPMSELMAEAAERRWFWATVSGVVAIVLAAGLVALNLVPNPSQPSSDLVTDAPGEAESTDPAAPSSQTESTTDNAESGSTTGSDGSADGDSSANVGASSTSAPSTTTRRVTTSQTRRPTSSTAGTTTSPPTTEDTTTSEASTSGTDASSTTDGSSSTTNGSSSSSGSTSSTMEDTTTSTSDTTPSSSETTDTTDGSSSSTTSTGS